MTTPGKDDKLKKFSLRARLRSFKNAFSGLAILLRYEHNAKIHLVILIVVLAAGLLLRIPAQSWIAVVLAAGLVFTAESFNTALEYLSDFVSPEYNDKIKKAKDVAAAAVFISAVVSAITGLVVFIPEILRLIRS